MLTSLPLPLTFDVNRSMTPFADAARRDRAHDASRSNISGDDEWQAVEKLSNLLDGILHAHVESVSVRRGRYHPLTLLFTIAETAFALTPYVTWERRVVVCMAAPITSEWFPPDQYNVVPPEALIAWVTRQFHDVATGRSLQPYAGPRLFGDHLLIDVGLPTLLEGCCTII